jgi:signal transduction histidine kinase/ActR/RegA family two-component response regulator
VAKGLKPDETTDYRVLFDEIDQGFCTIEVLFDENGTATDYRFLEVNRAFARSTGLSDVTGRRMRELAAAHEEHWFKIYGEVAVTGTPVRFEQQAAALGRWYDVYAFRIGEPHLRRVAILFSDITARRLWEGELEAAKREAERANRVKDEFLAMLGHELRNPLAPMLTALQLMRLHGSHSREQDVLERQVRHLTRMVDDLLDISRITRGKLELKCRPTELFQVALNGIELARPMLEQRQVSVDVQIPPTGAGANVEPARMAQVVANLLTNAAKYSQAGSRVILSATSHGATVRMSVKDNGVGLSEEMLEPIFEPFVQQAQTLERSRGGLGLGLAIVRNIVAAHGGVVRAESAGLHQGSEFIVELPCVTVPGAKDATEARTSLRRGRDRILVVDDNEDAVIMLRSALDELGYEVEVAFDGPSALLRAEAFQPSAVLLDIGLPVMDGYEVAARLRADRTVAHPPRLVALTGYGQDVDRQRSRQAGFHSHLVKPVDLERLQQLLEESPDRRSTL